MHAKKSLLGRERLVHNNNGRATCRAYRNLSRDLILVPGLLAAKEQTHAELAARRRVIHDQHVDDRVAIEVAGHNVDDSGARQRWVIAI